MFSSKSLRCPRAPGAELNLGSGSTGFSYSPCRTAEEMMMSLISHRAQRRVQGRRSSPSLCCAPGWGQGQQWLLCAAGAHPHSVGWKLLCLVQQSPQCDPPCAVAMRGWPQVRSLCPCRPGQLLGVGPAHGAEPQCWPCSWGFLPPALHRAAAAGALLLSFLFCRSFWVGVQGLCFLVLATDFLSDISSGKYCALA